MSTFDYAEAKAARDVLNARVEQAGKVLEGFPKGELGLTPDHIKASPEWRKAKAEFELAFAVLRGFNKTFTKQFKREIRADIDARRMARKLELGL